jgi:MtN3 and saliva related transmembrane protein
MSELSTWQIALIPIVGVIVAALSAGSKIFGFPDQIRKTAQRKSTEGLSLTLYIISFTTYFFWAIYGALREDWVVFLAHGTLGCITTGIILWQFYMYRKNKDV